MQPTIVPLSIPLWSEFIETVNLSDLFQLFHFQSHYGQEATIEDATGMIANCSTFNPTMVPKNLIVISACLRIFQLFHFQSHYGHGQSRTSDVRRGKIVPLSIPLWSTGNFPLFRYITFSHRPFTRLSSSTFSCAVSI